MEFQLTTLGTIDLRRPDGTSVESILQQPRRLSLLVYLAMAGRDDMVSRDDLVAMFWPESDTVSCRNALSQALTYLRRSVGVDAIITRGNEIALNPAVVVCDAVQLLHGLAAADPRTSGIDSALDLYRGRFMPGLFDSGSASFEQWVDNVRATLRRSASDAAWARANALADAGEAVGAAALARRAAAWMEADEVSLRAQMTLLARVGDRAGALDAFERFSRMLEVEYEMGPSGETVALAESIRESEPVTALVAEPGHAVAVVEPPVVTVRMDAPSEAAAGVPLQAKRRRFPVWAERLATVAGSVIVAGTILISWAARPNNEIATRMSASMMVANFGFDAADKDLAATSRRLRETLIHNLADGNLPFPVIDGAAGAGGGAVDISTGDHFEVVGGITRDGDNDAYFTVRVIDSRTSAVINSREFALDGEVSAIAGEASDFARYVVGAELDIRKRLSPAARDLVIASHRARMAAESLWSRGSGEVAALTLDGMDTKLASADLSGVAAAEIHIERAEIAFAKMWAALFSGKELSSTNASLRHGLAHVRAAELVTGVTNRSNEMAGLLYYWSWSTTPEQHRSTPATRLLRDSAVARLVLAVKDNHQSGRSWAVLGALYSNEGKFSQAQYAAEQAIRADLYARDVTEVRLRLFWAALESGDVDAARETCDVIERTMGNDWWGPYCRIIVIAWEPDPTTDQAALVRSLLAIASAKNDPYEPFVIAAAGVALARAGYKAEAVELYATLTGPSSIGDEVIPYKAWLATALGNQSEAKADLNRYVAAWPDARSGILKSRRYRN